LLSMLAACQPVDSPIMLPGDDCLSCHTVGGEGAGHVWTLAGTVFTGPQAAVTDGVQGAQVLVTDSNGKALTLGTNEAGNFYTAESLQFPVHVEVQQGNTRIGMDGHPAVGACNTCHNDPPTDEAIGRIFIKGQ
jgi:hypothetical protein